MATYIWRPAELIPASPRLTTQYEKDCVAAFQFHSTPTHDCNNNTLVYLRSNPLSDGHGCHPPYGLDALLELLPGGCRLAAEVRAQARNGKVLLTAQRAWEVLDS